MRRPRFALYLITDPGLGDVVEATRAALAALPTGAAAVQVRTPSLGAAAQLALARALAPVCRAREAPLLVNDRVDVALAAGADGVHLPERGVPVADARRALGAAAWIGRSCHDRAGLERAAADGADFATLSPIGAVPGKNPPLGVDGFRTAVDGLALPVHALGGVDAASAGALLEAGAAGVAVIRAVYGASAPGAAARALWDAIRPFVDRLPPG